MTVNLESVPWRGDAPLPPLAGYGIHTSLSVGSHIGPSLSSRCAAAALRFARFAVTATRQCGEAFP